MRKEKSIILKPCCSALASLLTMRGVLLLFVGCLGTVGCKYHANIDNYINSKQPPNIYTKSSMRKEFVKETVDNSEEVNLIQVDKRQVIIKGGLTNYPLNLVHNYITGSVEVFTCVDEEGIPKEFHVFSYNHEDFLTAALKSIKRTVFEKADTEKYYFIPIEYSIRHPFNTKVSYGNLMEVSFSQNSE